MTDYEIVAKTEVPKRERYGKWQALFTEMTFEQAIKLEFDNMDDANYQRSSLLGSFRHNRSKLDGAKLKTRLVHQSSDVIALYAWKEQK